MNLKQEILQITRAECKENDVDLYLGKGKSVQYPLAKFKVNGFFNFDSRITKKPLLACATGKPNWELTLVHELNHLRQWKENCPEWENYCKLCNSIIDDAISGKKVNHERLLRDAKITALMEHDCEKRSYQTLKDLGYPKAKLNEYAKKANSYVLFYLYVAKTRQWYKIGQEPYTLKSVWSQFPNNFDINIEKVFAKLSHLYDQCVS